MKAMIMSLIIIAPLPFEGYNYTAQKMRKMAIGASTSRYGDLSLLARIEHKKPFNRIAAEAQRKPKEGIHEN
jgi:hypothetical protein